MDLIELLRVWIAFGAVFAFGPMLASPRPAKDAVNRVARLFTRASLFSQVSALVLGAAGLCLPGAVLVLYALFLCTLALFTGRGRILLASWCNGKTPYRILVWMERSAAGTHRRLSLHLRDFFGLLRSQPILLALPLLLGTIWFPLHNLRFQEITSYSRALSLQVLVHGQPWQPDPAVAFLAPVVFLSGLDAATVLRFAGPLLYLLLIAAVALCAYRLSRSSPAALAAAALASMIPHWQGHSITAEPPDFLIAAIFWVLVPAFWKDFRWDCLWAAFMALLIASRPTPILFLWILTPLAVAAASRLAGAAAPPWLRRAAGTLLLFSSAWLQMEPLRQSPAEGPFQYESAARAVKRIASEFPRNDWLVVSTMHELPYTYGAGWHIEMADFTTQYSPAQISSENFRFPYTPAHLFVFVEKQPLQPAGRHSRVDLSQELDHSVAAYSTGAGRQANQFDAAYLLASYAATHRDARIYYEDDHLMVYAIGKAWRNTVPLQTAGTHLDGAQGK